MAVTFIGVRHHSPACARLVRDTIRRLRPAYVLVEGPADFGSRVDELLLGHEPPVAIFSYHRDAERVHASWSPFCAYSPEWVALGEGRAAGAELRFIDLPAWHPAFAARSNRYADAELRYAEVTARLCREFAVDTTDILWDHLFEIDPDGAAERLDAYFGLLRGEAEAGEDDTARESYMAEWIRAAAADAGDRPVVVVTGGFHKPALEALAASGGTRWPDVPEPAEGAAGGSFLVPYSFRRLDAFTGYQSGMPSPEYYQCLWESGPEESRVRAHRAGRGAAARAPAGGLDRRPDRRPHPHRGPHPAARPPRARPHRPAGRPGVRAGERRPRPAAALDVPRRPRPGRPPGRRRDGRRAERRPHGPPAPPARPRRRSWTTRPPNWNGSASAAAGRST
ncbi:DUF5682 family protein [Actinomadura madurae]|uniref:DUF5682 family protein n=1 Tax=Actinomadura madurae TaxID=1993 RepID=UPI0020D244A0|nr:DUF5682 family protein [Actinomadura madurae]MCP9977820.1 DUF5682 family protein [Actinomadura madurae]